MRAVGQLLRRELVARVAVGADRTLRVVGILHAAAFLRDLLAVLPVAEELAVGRPLDRREVRLLDPLGDVLRQRLAGVLAAGLLRVVLVHEAVELRLAPLVERGLEHRRRPWRRSRHRSARVAQPTGSPGRAHAAASAIISCLRCMAWPPSALDRGRVERGAVRVAGEEHRQRDRRVGREHELAGSAAGGSSRSAATGTCAARPATRGTPARSCRPSARPAVS